MKANEKKIVVAFRVSKEVAKIVKEHRFQGRFDTIGEALEDLLGVKKQEENAS